MFQRRIHCNCRDLVYFIFFCMKLLSLRHLYLYSMKTTHGIMIGYIGLIDNIYNFSPVSYTENLIFLYQINDKCLNSKCVLYFDQETVDLFGFPLDESQTFGTNIALLYKMISIIHIFMSISSQLCYFPCPANMCRDPAIPLSRDVISSSWILVIWRFLSPSDDFNDFGYFQTVTVRTHI